MPLPMRRTAVLLLVTLLGTVAAPVAAGASPIDDKKAEAAKLSAAINANGEKMDALNEQMNGARLQLQSAQGEIESARRDISIAKEQADALKSALAQRAAALYTDQAASGVEAGGDLSNPVTDAARSTYAAAAATKNNGMVSQLTLVKERLAEKKATFEAARASAQAQSDSLAASAKAIVELNANQQKLLAQTKGELDALVLQEQQRRDAEAQVAALAAIKRVAAATAARQDAARRATDSSASAGGATGSSGRAAISNATNTVLPANLPAPSPRAAQAIAFAQAQLGKPYVYAAAGPDTYDCSGLTMRAWGAAGVSMAHYSGAQYAAFPHVPLDQLQPGDLVFRGPGGSAHVGLYIGNGLMIAAPHTGDVVKVQPIRDQLPFGARPG
jgi:cell wall-associated NlpC family hydrolase